ncbi:MAG: hypothetical protein C4519_14030 [Desulfobacteraceae bacterium]|nr:MAG: hypothetical protein C4519_14030 [Desulfobacteraceae bacterium]
MLREGVKELGLEGNIDLEGTQGDIDADLNARFGYFLDRHLEVGPFFSFSRSNDGDVMSYGLGAFADWHLLGYNMVGFAKTVPYIGASLGLYFLDTDVDEDESGLSFIPRVGIKWFFRDYVAVDTNFFLALATDDIYVNDNDTDKYDIGINIGLRVYFE